MLSMLTVNLMEARYMLTPHTVMHKFAISQILTYLRLTTDAEAYLRKTPPYKKYPKALRQIRFYDVEQDRLFAYLMNAFHLNVWKTSNLYKTSNR